MHFARRAEQVLAGRVYSRTRSVTWSSGGGGWGDGGVIGVVHAATSMVFTTFALRARQWPARRQRTRWSPSASVATERGPGLLVVAVIHRVAAAPRKGQLRQVHQLGHRARNGGYEGRALPGACTAPRRGRAAKSRVCRGRHGREDRGGGAAFDHAAAVHHHIMRSTFCEITPRSCEIRMSAMLRSATRSLMRSRICCWMVTSSAVGLVGNQQVGPAGQRHRNGDPLALPPENWCG